MVFSKKARDFPCPTCQKPIPEESRFCNNCGEDLFKVDEQQPDVPTPRPEIVEQPKEEPKPTEQTITLVLVPCPTCKGSGAIGLPKE